MTSAPAILEDLTALGFPTSRRDGVVIAAPRTAEEVAAVTRYANENFIAIEIAGAGTKRSWDDPVEASIFLETHSLTGVKSHSWQDLTATVAAGTPWSAMQHILAARGQRIALDPLWPGTASVGGIVATNDSGGLRLKYGSLRDLIIGMTIVLADGTIAKSGGKVVKNVAGYDLHKLMTGACGTLGVITDVTFRLHPIPAHTRTWTVSSPDPSPLGALLLRILDSQLSTEAMQVRTCAGGFALDLELATLPEVLNHQMATLNKFAPDTVTPADHAAPFAARETLFTAAGGTILKATMLPTEIAAIVRQVASLDGSAVAQATGIMFAHFPEDAPRSLSAFTAAVAAAEGHITVLRGARIAHPATPLTIEIKRRFDPNRVLNPGRFLGGL